MLRTIQCYIPVSTLILLLIEAVMLMASTYLVRVAARQMLGVLACRRWWSPVTKGIVRDSWSC